jgi:CDP-glucose 4,6-dehydratase
LEPLAGYLKYAEHLWLQPDLAGACNFGPPTDSVATVREVILLAQKVNETSSVTWGAGGEGPHEAGWLGIETAKARTVLGFEPKWSLIQAVQRTFYWYKQQNQGADAFKLTMSDLEEYERS